MYSANRIFFIVRFGDDTRESIVRFGDDNRESIVRFGDDTRESIVRFDDDTRESIVRFGDDSGMCGDCDGLTLVGVVSMVGRLVPGPPSTRDTARTSLIRPSLFPHK